MRLELIRQAIRERKQRRDDRELDKRPQLPAFPDVVRVG